MRRQTFFSLIMLCALLLSGWSGVLASALCTHKSSAPAPVAEEMAADHSCCRAHVAQKPHAHQDSSGHESHHKSHQASQTSGGTKRAAKVDKAEAGKAEPVSSAFQQPGDSCLHCVGRPELPLTPVAVRPVTEQTRREVESEPQPVAKLTLSPFAVIAPLVQSRQHAPPGSLAPKHLLLSVFLI